MQRRIWVASIWLEEGYLGFVLLPVTVSKQLSLFLNKASTNHHHHHHHHHHPLL